MSIPPFSVSGNHFNDSTEPNTTSEDSLTPTKKKRSREDSDPSSAKRTRTEEVFENTIRSVPSQSSSSSSSNTEGTLSLFGRVEDSTNLPTEPDSTLEKMDVVEVCGLRSLPPELLAEIFGYLAPTEGVKTIINLGKTSNEFYHLSKTIMSNFIRTRLNHSLVLSKAEELEFFSEYAHLIYHLTLESDDDDPYYDDELSPFLSSCTNLRKLDLSEYASLDNTTALAIGQYCTGLETLDLSFSEFTDDELSSILEGCTNLKNLNLNHCEGLTTNAANIIAENCRELKSLDISEWNELLDMSVDLITRNCELLETLNLSGYAEEFETSVGDESILSIATNCRNLTSLSLEDCDNLTGAHFDVLARNCTALRHLNLKGCLGLTNKDQLITLFGRLEGFYIDRDED